MIYSNIMKVMKESSEASQGRPLQQSFEGCHVVQQEAQVCPDNGHSTNEPSPCKGMT